MGVDALTRVRSYGDQVFPGKVTHIARALNEEQLAEYQRLRQGGVDLESRDQRISALEGMVRRIAGMNELSKALVACGVGSACPHGEKMVSQATGSLKVNVYLDRARLFALYAG